MSDLTLNSINKIAHATLRATTSFVGRRHELEALHQQTQLEQTRWVHLWGVPGVGKTRLVKAFVQQWVRRTDGQFIWCDLTGATEYQDVINTIMTALERAQPKETMAHGDALADALADCDVTLVVLDGIDGVSAQCAQLIERVACAPECLWISTSRRRINHPEVHTHQVVGLGEEDARELFIARARQVYRDYGTEPETATLDEVLALVDRLPLAIEWVASRVRILPPKALLKRMDRSAQIIRGAGAQTLGTLFEAVFETLSESARQMLLQLSVFQGSFSLDAAEAVVDDPAFDVFEELLDCALLFRQESSVDLGDVRLCLLETVKAYVLQVSSFQPDVYVQRHAAFFLNLAQQNLDRARRAKGPQWIELVRLEQRNLRGVMSRGSSEQAYQVGLILDEMYDFLGSPEEHQILLDALLERFPDDEEALYRRARLAWRVKSSLSHADVDAKRIESLVDDPTDIRWQRARLLRAAVVREQGHIKDAMDLIGVLDDVICDVLKRQYLVEYGRLLVDQHQREAARRLFVTLSSHVPVTDLRDESRVQQGRAYMAFYLGDIQAQNQAHQTALALMRRGGHQQGIAWHVQGVAESLFVMGDWPAANASFDEALAQHRALGNGYSEGIVAGNYAASRHRMGEFEQAELLYRKAIALHRKHDASLYTGVVLHAFAVLKHEREDFKAAYRYYSEAIEHCHRHGYEEDQAAILLCRAWLGMELSLEMARDDLQQAQALFVQKDSMAWAWLARMSLHLMGDALGEEAPPSTSFSATAQFLFDALTLIKDIADHTAQKSALATLEFRAQATTSLYGRLAVRLVRCFGQQSDHFHAIQMPPPPATRHLSACKDGLWFQAAEQDAPVDLRRRKAIRLIFMALLEQHQQGLTSPMDVYALFEIGWPGQSIEPELAADRVYWAIRMLRNLGLRDVLLTRDDGYLLDPALVIQQG